MEDRVVVQNVLDNVKFIVNRQTLVLVVTNANSVVDASVFQLLLVSSFSKTHVTGHPDCVIVLVPAESIGLMIRGVEAAGTLKV